MSGQQSEIAAVCVEDLRAAAKILSCIHAFENFTVDNSRPRCRRCGLKLIRHDAIHPEVAAPLAVLLASIADEAERHAAKGWGNQADEIADERYTAIARAVLAFTGRAS